MTRSQSDMSRLEGDMSDDKIDKMPENGLNNGLTIDDINECHTLDEPIVETLMRDIRSIYTKLKFILIPISLSDSYRNVLKDWDLWGPLIVTTFLALTLHHNEEMSSGGTLLVGPHFAQIFVLIWFANCLVSLNYRLLNSNRKRSPSDMSNTGDKSIPNGYSPTTFQLLCVFGYCLSPAGLGVIVLNVFTHLMKTDLKFLFYEKLFVGLLFGFVWPTLSSLRIVNKYMDKEKRLLAAYPIGLFYSLVSWALITTH